MCHLSIVWTCLHTGPACILEHRSSSRSSGHAELPVPEALSSWALRREETSDQAAVLHFTYNRFEDLKSRRDRCDCAPTEEDAKRCFILPFDRMVRPLSCAAADTACGAVHALQRTHERSLVVDERI